MRFEYKEDYLGKFKKFILTDKTDGRSLEGLFTGATTLSYTVPFNGSFLNILDGFNSEEEVIKSRGARGWIMTPFPNRIPGGLYSFEGKDYVINPLPPREQVIHGFTSHEEFELKKINNNDEFLEVVLFCNKLRSGKFQGYPFDVDVYITYKLTPKGFYISVRGENVGKSPAPFYCGWHPYFKSVNPEIETLALEINAGSIIGMNSDCIPLPGSEAYLPIETKKDLNFNDTIEIDNRKINGRTVDVCYAEMKTDENGLIKTSLIDTKNSLKITMLQNRGVTLVFTGDSLITRRRESVAIEPMEFLTNSFNRPEFADGIKINPASFKEFNFGVEVTGL